MARIKISKDIQKGEIVVTFSYDPKFVTLLIFWKVVQIYGIFKSCLGIRVLKLQKSIPMLANGILDGLKALWILEADDNNKKLQFEGSSRVVYKRSSSQNMPIW